MAIVVDATKGWVGRTKCQVLRELTFVLKRRIYVVRSVIEMERKPISSIKILLHLSNAIVEREEERFFSKYEISIARESLKSNGFKRLTFTMEMANDIGTKRHGFRSTVKQTERWTFHGLALQSVAQFIATASI